MPGRDEIAYYVIKNPLRDEETIAHNDYEMERALRELDGGMKLRETLHVSQRKDGLEKKLIRFRENLRERYLRESNRLRGWKHFIRIGVGGAITYLAFPNLFEFGRNFPSYIFEWRGPASLQLLAGMFILGSFIASIPYVVARIRTHRISVRASQLKKYADLMKRLDEADLTIVENSGLASFHEEVEGLIENTRANFNKLINADKADERLKACRDIEDDLERMFRETKIHGLEGLDKYYHDLQTSFYELEKRIKKPRPWRRDKKMIKELLRA
ncbi:MAG: hypothetical protein ACE5GD_03405 [Candidatus Geothermarchaeales archaeon]